MEAVILFFVVIGLLVALPIVFSRLGALSAKQQKQQQHIDFLQQQLGDLWRKGYAPPMVNRIVNTETSAACEENPGAAQRQTVPAPSLQQPAPLPAFSDGRLWPAETPVPAPQMLYPPYPPARQPVYQAAQPNYQTAQLAAYRQQATASQATAPQVTAPQAAEVPDMSPPVQTQAPAPAVPVSPRARTVTENWIGRNVLGVAASILVFVGLIFLGRLIYEHITDTIKIILMFALSTVLTGVGVALSAKKRNAFTVILTGCGCGAFFISIMLTHIYFGRMNDIAAFSLLLAWTAATLFAARQIQSVAMSVVAHIGMIVSICFAYALGLSDEKLALLIVYQMVSSAVIV
ncbi:MAG: DUF2339 domain-containing protein, partial [Oscillospiraceae bacterium]|nr:DUF2339 domain-containing protein [Oscillospiraceae bacterium]